MENTMNNINNLRINKRNYVRCRMCNIQILYIRIEKCNKWVSLDTQKRYNDTI